MLLTLLGLIVLVFCSQGFTEVQMSKLKKSEVFTREREREIQQVNIFHCIDCKGLLTCSLLFSLPWKSRRLTKITYEGCGIGE